MMVFNWQSSFTIHSFSWYLLGAYFVSGTVEIIRDMDVVTACMCFELRWENRQIDYTVHVSDTVVTKGAKEGQLFQS